MRKKQLLAVLLTLSLADPSSVVALVTNSQGGVSVAYADEAETTASALGDAMQLDAEGKTFSYAHAVLSQVAKPQTLTVTVSAGSITAPENIDSAQVITDIGDKSVTVMWKTATDAATVQALFRSLVFNYAEGMSVNVTVDGNTTNDALYTVLSETTGAKLTQWSVNGHYYLYVPYTSSKLDSWTSAYNAALTYQLGGRKGYLATITQGGEQSYLANIADASVWVGATSLVKSDKSKLNGETVGENSLIYQDDYQTKAGSWRGTYDSLKGQQNPIIPFYYWASGPEAGQVIKSSIDDGLITLYHAPEAAPELNAYSGTGDYESCTAVYVGTKTGLNDIPERNFASGDTAAHGYFVEFGGWTGKDSIDSSKVATLSDETVNLVAAPAPSITSVTVDATKSSGINGVNESLSTTIKIDNYDPTYTYSYKVTNRTSDKGEIDDTIAAGEIASIDEGGTSTISGLKYGDHVKVYVDGQESSAGYFKVLTDHVLNGGFEIVSGDISKRDNDKQIPGVDVYAWHTTAKENFMEVREKFDSVTVPNGKGAELNARETASMYQEITASAGETLTWGVKHAGRIGEDTMAIVIGPALPAGEEYEKADANTNDMFQNMVNSLKVSQETLEPGQTYECEYKGNKYSVMIVKDGKGAWENHSASDYVVPTGVSEVVLAFTSVESAEGRTNYGNLIDDVTFERAQPSLALTEDANSGSLSVGGTDSALYDVAYTNTTLENLTPVWVDAAGKELETAPAGLTATATDDGKIQVTTSEGVTAGQYSLCVKNKYDVTSNTVPVTVASAVELAGENVEWYSDPECSNSISTNPNGKDKTVYIKAKDGYEWKGIPRVEGATVTPVEGQDGVYAVTYSSDDVTAALTLTAEAPTAKIHVSDIEVGGLDDNGEAGYSKTYDAKGIDQDEAFKVTPVLKDGDGNDVSLEEHEIRTVVTWKDADGNPVEHPTDAGTYTMCVDVTVDGEPFTTLKKTVTINPKTISVKGAAVKGREYDTTTKADIESLGELDGVLDADKGKVALTDGVSAAFDKADVGERTATFTFPEAPLTGDKAKNYKLSDDAVTAKATIRPAALNAENETLTWEDAQPDGDGYAIEYDGEPAATPQVDKDKLKATAGGKELNPADLVYTYEWYRGDEKLDGAPTECGDYTMRVTITSADGNYTTVKNVPVKIADTLAPTGTVQVADKAETLWDKLVDTFTFGLFYNEKQTVTVTTADGKGMGVEQVSYYVTPDELNEETVANPDINWTKYTGEDTSKFTFDIGKDEDGEQIVYVKIQDKAGNVKYISTNGLVFDKSAPKVTGVQSDGTYTKSTPFTVDEENLESITVINGDDKVEVSGNSYTLLPSETPYTIIVKDKAGNETTISNVTVDWARVDVPSVDSKVYTGEKQTADIQDGTIGEENVAYTVVKNEGGTDAGTYDVVLKLNDTVNYKWNTADGVTLDEAEDEATVAFEITKADAKLTKVPAAKDLTFDGKAQALVDAGEAVNGTVWYKLGDGEWTTEVPTATEAGTYKVSYKVVGDENFNDVEPVEMEVTIAPKSVKEADVEVALGDALVYNGKEQTQTVAKVVIDGVEVPADAYTITGNKATKAGTYTMTITMKEGSGYTGSFTKEFTVVDTSLTYTGGKQQLVNITAPTGSRVWYRVNGGEWTDEVPTASEAGTYKVEYKIVADGEKQEEVPVAGTYTVTIAKKSVENAKVDVVFGDSLVYNGKEQTQTVAKVVIDGVEVPADSYTITGNVGTKAGTYVMTITMNENSDYEGSFTKEFTIAEAPKKNDSSDSGDTFHPLAYMAGMFGAALAGAGVLFGRKKREDD